MKVIILGGTGHIGQTIQAKAKHLVDVELSAANRQKVNLRDPSSYTLLDDFDIVINATDTYNLPPFDLYQYSLARPITLIETTAESEVYLKLREFQNSGPGRVITGMGVFPGLSNLFVSHHDLSAAKKVELVISWSLFSEAGAGTIEVMIGAMQRPTWRWRNHKLEQAKIMGEVRQFDDQLGMEIGLPEPIILGPELAVEDFQVFAATKPALPKIVTHCVRAAINSGLMKLKPVEVMSRTMFRLFRKKMMAGKKTQCQMTLWVDDKAQSRLAMDDAFSVAGSVIAVGIQLLQPGKGVQTPNQCFKFENMLQQIQAWGENITFLSLN